MLTQKSYIDANGRLAIPAKIRQIFKLKPGDEVSLNYSENKLVVSTFASNIEKARNILNRYQDIDLQNELKTLRKEDM
jgi:AbrB family looped-hinge helix DNA binding protein